MELTSRQRGFSLVEVMIAAGIFLIIALGVLPLFTQAIRNNLAGRNATDVSNLGKSRVEELLQVPFDNLTVPAGATAACTAEYWSLVEKKWKPLPAPTPATECAAAKVDVSGLGADAALWVRTTRVQQYSLADVMATGTANPLNGGAAVGNVHLKEMVVEVTSGGKNDLNAKQLLTLRMLRAI